MSSTLFFQLLDVEEKRESLGELIERVRLGVESPRTFCRDPLSFRIVPGSPLGYWVADSVLQTFAELPSASATAQIKQGLGTLDDFRFVRLHWEPAPRNVSRPAVHGADGRAFQEECMAASHGATYWFPFAKGGKFSPYYADPHLLVNWKRDGEEMKEWIVRVYGGGHWSRNIRNVSYYFISGLTWSRRSQAGFSVRALPSGCILSDKSPTLFPNETDLAMPMLGLMSSGVFQRLLALQMAFGSFEAGVIERTPVPDLARAEGERLGELATACFSNRRQFDSADETSHVFVIPMALSVKQMSLQAAQGAIRRALDEHSRVLDRLQAEVDALALQLYGFDLPDALVSAEMAPTEGSEVAEDDESETGGSDSRAIATTLASWALGCTFGRFDARIALDSSLAPQIRLPFDPLPVCPPGMLVGPDGLPATRNLIASEEWLRARPSVITFPPDGAVARPTIPDSEYPIAVDWDGILVDDPEHGDDVVRRIRDVLHLIWGDGAEGIEREACEMLGVRELGEWFRNPRNFWDDHVKRYSKSRRKAPIYWLLQSAKRSYGLWLYYHRLDSDLYAKALVNYVEPKVRHEETRLKELRGAFQAQQPSGATARKAEREIERQEALISELEDFRASLDRVVKLGLQPDLDDGVVLNIAPLHELVPWKVARQYWEELLAGKYEWSTISKQLRAKGLAH
jgi:hypothetical protein